MPNSEEIKQYLEESAQNDEFPMLDSLMEGLRAELEKDRTLIANPSTIRAMNAAYDILSKIVHKNSPDAKIECELDNLLGTNGVISIETDELIAKNIAEFVQGIKSAENFEVYPLTNGNIKINILFKNVMTEIKND